MNAKAGGCGGAYLTLINDRNNFLILFWQCKIVNHGKLQVSRCTLLFCRFQVNNRWTIRRRLYEFLLSAFLRRDTRWEMCRIRTTIERFQRKTTNRSNSRQQSRLFFFKSRLRFRIVYFITVSAFHAVLMILLLRLQAGAWDNFLLRSSYMQIARGMNMNVCEPKWD